MNDREIVSLTELLAQNAERVLAQLLRVLKDKGGPGYQRLATDVLQTRIQRLFDAFWQGVAQNDPRPMTDYIATASRERGQEGFTVAEVQTVGLCLRDALLEVVDEAYATDPAQHLKVSRHIEELILSGLGAGVKGFVDGREALIARQYEALRRSQKKGTDGNVGNPQE